MEYHKLKNNIWEFLFKKNSYDIKMLTYQKLVILSDVIHIDVVSSNSTFDIPIDVLSPNSTFDVN